MFLRHGRTALWASLGLRNVGRGPDRRRFVTLRHKFQERSDRRGPQFLVNTGRHRKQLPDLPTFERDFENPLFGVVSQALHLLIEDFNTFCLYRRHEVRTLFNLLLAFLAKHHRCEDPGQVYTEHMYGSQRGSRVAYI